MLAACVTLLVASGHEQRAYLLSVKATHPRPGVVVTMARSMRSGIIAFFPNIFSNRDESLAGEDRWRRNEWKRALIGTVILAVGIALIEGIFRLTRYQAFHIVTILTSLIVLSGIPQMACDSIVPFLRPHVRFGDGRIIIRGQRLTSIGYLASYMLLCLATVGALVLGLLSHDLRDGIGFALGPAFFAYFLYSHNPLEDLKKAIKDVSVTTLSPDGIHLHAALHLSIHKHLESASDGCSSDSSVRWDHNVKIYALSTTSYHVDLLADPDTYAGPWGLCCRTIGMPFTGLDALMRYFTTSTPRTVHSWPHRKASTSLTTSSPRPTWNSQPHKGGADEHQETHPRDADRRGPGRHRHLPDVAPRIPRRVVAVLTHPLYYLGLGN